MAAAAAASGSKELRLRCKCSGGETHQVAGLGTGSTMEELVGKISALTNIQGDRMRIKIGYPPKILDTGGLPASSPLSLFPIQNGDILIIEDRVGVETVTSKPPPFTPAPAMPPPTQPKRQSGEIRSGKITGMLLRRAVPADNSCLFSSVNFALNDGALEEDCVPSMRQLIAATVLSDPATYTAAMLGRDNQAYCNWILDPESWGGAIELSILSRHYNTEMCVVETRSGTVQRFGEDCRYPRRIFLIYDGIHYDPLMLEPFVPGRAIETCFRADDFTVLQQAQEVAEEGRLAHQYTDTTTFTLKCLECGAALKGELEAQRHALETKHTNFGEQ